MEYDISNIRDPKQGLIDILNRPMLIGDVIRITPVFAVVLCSTTGGAKYLEAKEEV